MGYNGILVADGGFGTQITEYVGQKIDGDPLWSSRFNITNPEAVIKTHVDFLKNGAHYISTNTYQATNDLLKDAVQLAKTARETFWAQTEIKPVGGFPTIMASIGPFGAHLRDGSEYTGNYANKVTAEDITDFQRSRIDACLQAGVDGLAIETIPNQMEAEAMAKMMCTEYPHTKFWLSFQCRNEESLANGDSFTKAALSVWDILKSHNARDKCIAIGLNCVQPKFVTPLFRSLNGDRRAEDKIPLVVYPNSGEVYDAKKGSWAEKDTCVALVEYIPEWVELNVKIIGGCCRVHAKDIALINETLQMLNTTK